MIIAIQVIEICSTTGWLSSHEQYQQPSIYPSKQLPSSVKVARRQHVSYAARGRRDGTYRPGVHAQERRK
eukprot:683944-Pleurochrysis_carterae.AAC.6